MTITPIETIKREAEEAAFAGKTRTEACRFPFDSAEGVEWRRCYDDAGGPFYRALAAYRTAIGADAA